MAKEPSYRLIAARQLDRNERTDAYVGLTRRGKGGDPAVERSVTDTVAGVTRFRRHLDYLIDQFYKGRPDQLETGVRTVLRIGLYELLHTRTPDHAAINEAVETVADYVHPRVKGLVNGILRTAARRVDDFPEPDTGDAARDLAILHSHPDWVVRRWLDRYGSEDTRKLLAYNNSRPRYGVHIRKDREAALGLLTDAGIEWEESPWLSEFIRADSVQPLVRSAMLTSGSVRVQDEAAALVVHAMAPLDGMRMLDACAAPGGKTMYAADIADGVEIVAADLNPRRLSLVGRMANRMGLTNVSTHAMDAAKPDPSLMYSFDTVLVDAPCSGLGVLSKRADLRWQRSEQDLAELTALQDRILDGCAQCVRPGGLLVYSTCTLEPEENEQRVEAFLERNGGFSLEPIAGGLVAGFPTELVDSRGFYRSLPFESGVDGAFAARFRRS